jgi:hypothetical protein
MYSSSPALHPVWAQQLRVCCENGAKVVIADVQDEAGKRWPPELNGVFVRCDVTSEQTAKPWWKLRQPPVRCVV